MAGIWFFFKWDSMLSSVGWLVCFFSLFVILPAFHPFYCYLFLHSLSLRFYFAFPTGLSKFVHGTSKLVHVKKHVHHTISTTTTPPTHPTPGPDVKQRTPFFLSLCSNVHPVYAERAAERGVQTHTPGRQPSGSSLPMRCRMPSSWKVGSGCSSVCDSFWNVGSGYSSLIHPGR